MREEFLGGVHSELYVGVTGQGEGEGHLGVGRFIQAKTLSLHRTVGENIS